jgi:hypothetical protein
MTEFDGLSDHFILRMYEFLRTETLAGNLAGTKFVGSSVKRRADQLFQEIDRRGLFCEQIEWPEHFGDAAVGRSSASTIS